MNAILLSLLVALRAVESSNGTDISNGKGDYQIERICVADVNRVYGTHYRYPRDVQNRKRAEEIAILYMAYWGPRVDKNPTAETFARVFHRGPKKWNDAKGTTYWHKVKKHLPKELLDDNSALHSEVERKTFYGHDANRIQKRQ